MTLTQPGPGSFCPFQVQLLSVRWKLKSHLGPYMDSGLETIPWEWWRRMIKGFCLHEDIVKHNCPYLDLRGLSAFMLLLYGWISTWIFVLDFLFYAPGFNSMDTYIYSNSIVYYTENIFLCVLKSLFITKKMAWIKAKLYLQLSMN